MTTAYLILGVYSIEGHYECEKVVGVALEQAIADARRDALAAHVALRPDYPYTGSMSASEQDAAIDTWEDAFKAWRKASPLGEERADEFERFKVEAMPALSNS